MNQSAVTIEFEKLTLSALRHNKKMNPEKQPTVRTLQGIVSQYCKEKNKKEINWKDTDFSTLNSYVKHLQTQNYIELDGNAIKIKRTKYKKLAPIPKKPILRNPLSSTTRTIAPLVPILPQIATSRNNTESHTTSAPELLLHLQASAGKGLRRGRSAGLVEIIDLCEERESKRQKVVEEKEPKKKKVEITKPKLAKEKLKNVKRIPIQKPVQITCPVCNIVMPNLSESAIDQHVDECLTMQLLATEKKKLPLSSSSELITPSPPLTNTVQYVVQSLPKDLDSSVECSICFEPYLANQQTARLECLCFFHSTCFLTWFQKKKCCPLHTPK